MNGTAQRERHTAITELRADVETVVEGVMRTVSRQFAQEREAWTQEIAAEHAHIVKVQTAVDGRLTSALEQLRLSFNEVWATVEPLQRPTFLSRLRWLVTGK